jgi:hypothetical protein
MEDDDVAVAGESQVDFDIVHAQLNGFFDGAERVLKHVAGGAAMAYAKHPSHQPPL